MAVQKQTMSHSLLTLLYRESIPNNGVARAKALMWYVLGKCNRQKDGQCDRNILTRAQKERKQREIQRGKRAQTNGVIVRHFYLSLNAIEIHWRILIKVIK